MALPNAKTRPSEITVQNLGNHFILLLLRDPRAWIICPTPWEEKLLGYDSAVGPAKLAIIQFKRIQTVRADGSVSFGIRSSQHQVLTSNFKQYCTPYVFYAFSGYRSYEELDSAFLNAGSPWPFANFYFIDAHAVPIDTTTLVLSKAKDLIPCSGGTEKAAISSFWTGPEFIGRFKNCTHGLRQDLREPVGFYVQERRQVALSHLSVLVWPLRSV